jgi:dTDP-4-dehydrorhamnose 3,5-epimerase
LHPLPEAAIETTDFALRSLGLQFEPLEIEGLVKIVPRRHADPRGVFSEVFRDDVFRKRVADVEFVQHNQSLSVDRGTVRGLHFQLAPKAQGKLVRCLSGAMLDIAVDIRKNSPTFGKHVAVELSAATGDQLWVPAGFAHGFCTLEPNTSVFYAVTDYYSPEHDRGLFWNDPDLAIAWPVRAEDAILSDKDTRQPRLAELPACF